MIFKKNTVKLYSVQRIVAPYKHACNTGARWEGILAWLFYRLKQYFNVCALIFYLCEGLSQAIKHAKKL